MLLISPNGLDWDFMCVFADCFERVKMALWCKSKKVHILMGEQMKMYGELESDTK